MSTSGLALLSIISLTSVSTLSAFSDIFFKIGYSKITSCRKSHEETKQHNNGIKKTQLDLDGINREVDNKFKVLEKITQQERAKSPSKKGTAINPQINDSVRQLKRQGWTIADIAKRLNLTENEVDLILQLPE